MVPRNTSVGVKFLDMEGWTQAESANKFERGQTLFALIGARALDTIMITSSALRAVPIFAFRAIGSGLGTLPAIVFRAFRAGAGSSGVS